MIEQIEQIFRSLKVEFAKTQKGVCWRILRWCYVDPGVADQDTSWGFWCQLRRGGLGASGRSTLLWRQTLITVPPKPRRSSWPPRSSCDPKRTQKVSNEVKRARKGVGGSKRVDPCFFPLLKPSSRSEAADWKPSCDQRGSDILCERTDKQANRENSGKQPNGSKTWSREFSQVHSTRGPPKNNCI